MKNVKTIAGLPDPLASNKEKSEKDYGLEVAKTIEKEWFNGGIIAEKCEFYNRVQKIQDTRLAIRGEQDTDPYKKLYSRQDGDLDLINLDWSVINIPEKFCNIVSNDIGDEFYRIDVVANDRLSTKIKQDKHNEHKRNMRAMPLFKQAKEKLGLDIMPNNFIPEDDEELELYEQIKERPKIEIAEEIIIDYIKKVNNWQNIETEKNRDLVRHGIAVSRVWTDPVEGIKLEYVDPENFGHSYVEKNDFSDAHYFFVVNSITVNELAKESGYSETILRKIAETYASNNNKSNLIYDTCDMKDILSIKVDVMRFAFKTTKTNIWKKHLRKGKTIKISKKDKSFNPPEGRSDYDKLTSVKTTWFEGNYVIGSEYLYNYKESENIVRDEMDNPLPPFIVRATDIYKNRLHSIYDNIKPLASQMQQIHYKIQHLIAELKPDLITINLDQLAELDSKAKKEDVWKTALSILNVKGVVFEKDIDMGEMGVKKGTAARPTPISQGTALAVLLNTWAHYYNLIRDITGINPARDGSLPADALLGVNRMAQLASNTSTKHIVDASVDFNKKMAELISRRVHGIYSYKQGKDLQKMYNRAVGKQNVDAIEIMKNRGLRDFGFTIELIPSKEEIDALREDLALSVKEGYVDVETKSEAQQIAKTNIKLANKYLFYKRRKKIKELQQQEEHKAKVQAQSNAQASQVAAQNQAQIYGIKVQMDLKKEAQLSQIRIVEAQAMQQIKQPEREQEFKEEVYLKQLEVASTFNLNKFKEDAKDLRINRQSSNQSKMIDQRLKDTGPIDFEQPDYEDIFAQKLP